MQSILNGLHFLVVFFIDLQNHSFHPYFQTIQHSRLFESSIYILILYNKLCLMEIKINTIGDRRGISGNVNWDWT